MDIDGVLNTTRSTLAFGPAHMGQDEPHNCLDPIGLAYIQRLQEVFDVKIVITSSWRHGSDVEELSQKLNIKVHDRIWKEQKTRGKEIKLWLEENPGFDEFAILDDDTDFEHDQREHFVHVDEHDGISYVDMRKLYLILDIDIEKMMTESPRCV